MKKVVMSSCAVIGAKGIVGSNIAKLCKQAKMKVYEVDMNNKNESTAGIDFLHFCVPYEDKDSFTDMIEFYVNRWTPKYFIIHSSVPPGTTESFRELKSNFVYSPVRGQHDNMLNDMKRYTKYAAGLKGVSIDPVIEHFQAMGLKISTFNKPEWLELAKLLDVSFFGMMISWAQESDRICKKFNVNHNFVRRFGEETQEFYKLRPDVYPSFAGGSCIRQDIVLLNQLYESSFFKAFMESNLRKAKEEELDDAIDRCELQRMRT